MIGDEARKIRIALAAQESGARIDPSFLIYAVACHNLIAKSAPIRSAHKTLDNALQGLSARVAAAYAKIAPSDLLKAIRLNDSASIDAILKVSDLHNVKLPNGELPLHYAIRLNRPSVVKYFLEKGCVDPLMKDHQGLTAFDHAFISKNEKMIALVLSASLGKAIPESALLGQVEMGEWQKLAQDIRDIRSPKVTELHPLHQAAFMGDIEELDKLARQKIDLNGSDLSGMTAIHYAVLGGNEDAVRYLLQRKVRLDTKTANGMTLLHLSAMSGSAPILKQLLDTLKFDPNASDASGRTPLHFAAAATHLDAARLLVERGGDPLVKTMRTTPFTIFKVLAEQRSSQRDPLALDSSAAATFGSFVASAASHYWGQTVSGKFFSALPVLAKLWSMSGHGSQRNRPKWQTLMASLALPYAMGTYLMDEQNGKMALQAMNSAALGKTLMNQLRICWANSALETYRPIRNALIHSANALFAGWELLNTSGIKKKLVCSLGTPEQCILQEDLSPRFDEQPKCKGMGQTPMTSDQLQKYCDTNLPQENLSACKKRIWTHTTQVMTQCDRDARENAETILGLGGYPEKTLDESDTALRAQFPKKTAPLQASRIEDAYQTLKTPPPVFVYPVDPCESFPQNLPPFKLCKFGKNVAAQEKCVADVGDRVLALNPECKDQARAMLGGCTDTTSCNKNYKTLSLLLHPDKAPFYRKANAAFQKIKEASDVVS